LKVTAVHKGPINHYDDVRNTYNTGTGQVMSGIHRIDKDCILHGCSVHNPTNHSMVEWPTSFREDTGMMERVCEHGVGHPDPNALAISG
jgi:hypothetical protein